jgi:hypothetical protein
MVDGDNGMEYSPDGGVESIARLSGACYPLCLNRAEAFRETPR